MGKPGCKCRTISRIKWVSLVLVNSHPGPLKLRPPMAGIVATWLVAGKHPPPTEKCRVDGIMTSANLLHVPENHRPRKHHFEKRFDIITSPLQALFCMNFV